MPFENLAHTAGHCAISREIRSDENRSWAQVLCSQCRHCGANAESSCFIRSRTDDRAIAFPRNNHGLAAQFGIIALLNRGVEGIHVGVDDFPHDSLASSYLCSIRRNVRLIRGELRLAPSELRA